MMQARTTNLSRFQKAMVDGNHGEMMASLVHDFGGKENARAVLAYLSVCGKVLRLERRIRMAAAFGVGVIATTTVMAIVHYAS